MTAVKLQPRQMVQCAVSECTSPTWSKGLCTLHYDRQRRTGAVELPPRPTLEQRLWARVDKSGVCWLWTGALNASGYGVIGSSGAVLRVHRLVYEMTVGPIPDGLQLDHLCRVRACCKPAHLEPVTNRENWLRGEHKTARAVRTGQCASGLHDMAESSSTRPNGSRYCRECAKLARRSREQVS